MKDKLQRLALGLALGWALGWVTRPWRLVPDPTRPDPTLQRLPGNAQAAPARLTECTPADFCIHAHD